MNTRLLTIVMLTLMLGISACVDVDITTPHGPKGPKGPDGASDYDLWKQEVEAGRIEWDKKKLALTDFFKFLKGNDGQDGTNGTDGKDGKSAYELWKEKVLSEEGVENPHSKGNKWSKDEISVPDFWRYLTGGTGEVGQVPQIKEDENGVPYWYVGDDKIRKATGEDGDPGDNAVPPTISIIDGFWAVDGVKTDKTATPTDGTNGKPGKTPTVDINPTTGNWVLNGEETNTSAKGQDGHTPVVTIDPKTGEWKIDGNPTGKTAFGQKGLNGDNGQDGKSAYELWKEEVEKGTLKDPHNEGRTWPPELNKPTDFWDYLLGGDEYKVVLIHALRDNTTEMVNPYDGSVAFQIIDAKGNLVGGTVTGISPVDKEKSFTAVFRNMSHEMNHRKIHFVLKRNDLPDRKPVAERTMYPKIKVKRKARTYVSSEPVVVPNKVHIRAVLIEEVPNSSPRKMPTFMVHVPSKLAWARGGSMRTAVRVEREMDDGSWEPISKVNSFAIISHDFYLLDVKQKPTVELLSSEHARKFPWEGYSQAKAPNYIQIETCYRPIRLTSEMVDAYTNGTEEQKKILKDYALWSYRGDDTWTYAAIAVGDNDGEKEQEERGGRDYGDFYVVPELIYFPPQEAVPGFNHSKIFVDKTTDPNNPIIWGEADYTTEIGEHYWNFATLVKQQDNGITLWNLEPTSKRPKEDASSIMKISLIDPANKNKEVEVAYTDKQIYDNRYNAKNFFLKKAKDGYYIAINFFYAIARPLDCNYYGTVRYKVKHDATTGNWSLVNIWKPSEEYPLVEKTWPGQDYYEGKVNEEGQPYPPAP